MLGRPAVGVGAWFGVDNISYFNSAFSCRDIEFLPDDRWAARVRLKQIALTSVSAI